MKDVREIKFRAYLFTDKMFHYFDIYDGLSGFYGGHSSPQQFTGLKDKNGKEIYEGDIVCENLTSEDAAEGNSCNLGQVFFSAGSFMIDGDGLFHDHVYSNSPDVLEDYLVVGNIFENPELMDRNK